MGHKTVSERGELLSEKLSVNAWVIEMWSRNLTRQFLFFYTYLNQTLLQEKSENVNCCGTYSFKNVEDWIDNLINDTNLAKLFIPINIDNEHWVLIVVDIFQRSIHYYDGRIGQIPSFLKSGMLIAHLRRPPVRLSPGKY